jgi:hypothetical protein
VFSRAVVKGNATTFQKGKCAVAPDTTVWVGAVKALFETLTVSEGLVNDPFNWQADEKLALWRDQAGRNWIWLNADGLVQYAQRWDAMAKKSLVYKILPGQVNYDSSAYDFIIPRCLV